MFIQVVWLIFFYGTHKIFGYTIELRPNSASPYGFILPPQFIIPTGIENFHAIIDFSEHILNKI